MNEHILIFAKVLKVISSLFVLSSKKEHSKYAIVTTSSGGNRLWKMLHINLVLHHP